MKLTKHFKVYVKALHKVVDEKPSRCVFNINYLNAAINSKLPILMHLNRNQTVFFIRSQKEYYVFRNNASIGKPLRYILVNIPKKRK